MADGNGMAEAFDDGDDYPAAAAQVQATMASILDTIRAEHDSPVDILVLGYRNVVQDGAVGLTTYGPDGLEQAKQATAYGNDALRQAAEHGGATYLDTGISPRNMINGVRVARLF